MTHREKIDHLIADLAERGISEYASAPPAWRTAWGLGLKVPPPHFIGFIPMAFTTGIVFGVLWGLAMHFLIWRSMGWLYSASAGVAVGVLFGISMAAYYRNAASKLKLPPWERYPGG